jgi:hypothetical protein
VLQPGQESLPIRELTLGFGVQAVKDAKSVRSERFIRLRQTGTNADGDNQLVLLGFDVFGLLIG